MSELISFYLNWDGTKMSTIIQHSSRLTIYLAVAVLLFFGTIRVSVAAEIMQLEPGESRVVNTDFDMVTIAVGDPDICDVTRVSPREVLINAKTKGKTNILIWDSEEVKREIDVTVGKLKDAQAVAAEVTELLRNVEGVNVRVAGDRVIVEGSVFSRKDLKKVSNVLEGSGEIINAVTISSTLRNVEAEEIKNAIGKKGVQVRPTEDGYLLQGQVSSEEEARQVEAIARGFTENIVSALGIKKKIAKKVESNELVGALIQVDLNVIEIEKDALADISSGFTASAGLNFSGASNADEVVTGFLSINEPNLRKIQEKGKARSLVQQSLVTQSSEQATFFAGEEFPVTTAQEGGELSTDFKKVGLTLDILPIAIKGDILNLRINVESSNITGEGNGGAPILSTIQLSTSTRLFSGENIALGGVIKQRVSQSFFGSASRLSKNTDEIGNFGRGDGAFWRTPKNTKRPNRYLNEQNEVLVIITPKILRLPADAIQGLGPEILKTFKEYEYEDFDN